MQLAKDGSSNSITVVCGAGASRSVSYAETTFPSPLDFDFFDLLQRVPRRSEDITSIRSVLEWARADRGNWNSLERCFYTSILKAQMNHLLFGQSDPSESVVRDRFAQSIQAILRAAHRTETCTYHTYLFSALRRPQDTVITFNYDLVIERSLRPLCDGSRRSYSKVPFGPWIYGFEEKPPAAQTPILLKLHGSSNWIRDVGKFSVKAPADWEEFSSQPGYWQSGQALMLPFWDKKIEDEEWLSLWKMASAKLCHTDRMIVWGYSLPATDLKARELFRSSCKDLRALAVIDVSSEARSRWRELFPNASYWPYQSIQEFIDAPPEWWKYETRDEWVPEQLTD